MKIACGHINQGTNDSIGIPIVLSDKLLIFKVFFYDYHCKTNREIIVFSGTKSIELRNPLGNWKTK